MYDKTKIVTGLVIALIILTFPIWWNLPSATPAAPDPKLTPEAQKAGQCVLPKEEIKTGHMQLLDEWRNNVVRDGQRYYVADNGVQYNMSLQNTCMSCHSSKVEFCDQCHNYTGVTPFCWDCHLEPEEKR